MSTRTEPRIVAFLEDIFFLSKIENLCGELYIAIEITSNLGKLKDYLSDPDGASVLLVDFNLNQSKMPEIIHELRTEFPKLPIVGFASFRQQPLLESCKLAGATEVFVKTDFMERIEEILKRYTSR